MKHFYKYQGTGNDFIIFDDREKTFVVNQDYIEMLCDRRFGIGADGLILLQNHEDFDFKMVYFNSDGRESSMCGNGGRCIVAFANLLKIIEGNTVFTAIDGMHEATITEDEVSLKMSDVISVTEIEDSFYLDTGSPHYVSFVDELDEFPLIKEAQSIRYNDRFQYIGTNVNYVSAKSAGIRIRTYERGVEDETLSCGTGATACAIASYLRFGDKTNWDIDVEGGELNVKFDTFGKGFNNIWLSGPAELVFEGNI
jgi:diaminopimelate epimerase